MPDTTTADPLVEALRERGFCEMQDRYPYVDLGRVRVWRSGLHAYAMVVFADDTRSVCKYQVPFAPSVHLPVIIAAVDAALKESRQ